MDNAMSSWPRLFRLLGQHSLAQTLSYRLSAAFVVVFGTLFAVGELASLLIYFQFTDSIAGWGLHASLALIATFGLIQHTYQFFFVVSHEALMDKIVHGELDYDLVRPVDSQLLCSLKSLDFPSLINMIIPVGILLYAWPHLDAPASVATLGAYLLLVLCGVVFYYLLNQLFVGLSFWIERPQQLAGVPEYLLEFATRPRTIYPRWIQFALAVVLPVLTATNTPVDLLRGELELSAVLPLLAAIALLAVAARWQWRRGVRRYVSAS
ncbi:ABC-2 family transporter protein [Sorangium sp. So ce119]|uniref:ABC transporter permease n=1 Tax=Sorangium sp. So ce119 TaxID=3133279 RepID=UPI003F640341